MANDINNVIIVGRLTRDAELSYTNSGYALLKFSLAVNQRRKQGDEWGDVAHYFDVVLWGRLGETLNSYMTKGQQVCVKGALRHNRWQQDGVNRSRVNIEAETIQLVGGRREGNGAPRNGHNQSGSMAQPEKPPADRSFESYTPPSGPVREEDFEDDVPF